MEIKTGDKFGQWTVIGLSDKKYYYKCKCDCGVIKDVYRSSLKLGKSLSCGHDTPKVARLNYFERSAYMIGKRYGRLVAREWTIAKDGRSALVCDCDCGNEVVVNRWRLENGRTRSCGCLRAEKSTKSFKDANDKWEEMKDDFYVEGTALHSLDQNISKNNKTGVKGVSRLKSGKYRAYIFVKRKQIHLGTFDSLEDAKEARLKAEKKYFEPLLEKYDKLE